MVDPHTLRHGSPAALAAALVDARARSLRLFDAYEYHLPRGMDIPYAAELNPPRWELGHIAWFEEFWIARNPLRLHGAAAAPDTPRAAPVLPGADALYNSSLVAHTRRWHLDLPAAAPTRRYAAVVRERTLALLRESASDDAALYFFRLALAHEEMHREAWIYMAQHLGLRIADAIADIGPAAPAASRLDGEVALAGGRHRLGSTGEGFCFDNELGAHEVDLAPFSIDRAVLSWRRFLPFVDAGGYDDARWWSAEGWAWRQRPKGSGNGRPRFLRRVDDHWQHASFGCWVDLDLDQPAIHLTQHEAAAWCRWSGRRLPSEAEWEFAAATLGAGFEWGQVWEWTASPFAPYPGFTPHPYRDYSQPWFDGRPVLRGASFATAPRMKHLRYRNYFPAERNDLFAGFRSCAA